MLKNRQNRQNQPQEKKKKNQIQEWSLLDMM